MSVSPGYTTPAKLRTDAYEAISMISDTRVISVSSPSFDVFVWTETFQDMFARNTEGTKACSS
jgi:hypothetical protein